MHDCHHYRELLLKAERRALDDWEEVEREVTAISGRRLRRDGFQTKKPREERIEREVRDPVSFASPKEAQVIRRRQV